MADYSIFPEFSPIGISEATINLILAGVIVSAIAAFVFRFASHRVYVIIYEQVKGGYVSTSGRYRKRFEKDTNMHSLMPMTGKMKLPAFDYEDYQKVSGAPIIGIKRQIKLIKVNKHTYYPMRPSDDMARVGMVQPYNSIGWVYGQVNSIVDKTLRRGGLFRMLSYAAPSAVIIAAIVILASALWTDNMLLQEMVTQIQAVGKAMVEVCSRWIE